MQMPALIPPLALALGLVVTVSPASAGTSDDGSYFCPYGNFIGNGRCSDGTIAVYRGGGTIPVPNRPAPVRQSLIGAWSTNVPGAVWTTRTFPGWATLHIAPGALAGLLVIYPNGNYVWNSYGGKRGRWRASGDSEYPILLDDPIERRQWKIGFNTRKPGAIWIVEGNGYFWYAGTRAR